MKTTMKRCPNCGNDTFYVTAHVTQGWIVDEKGNFLECIDECEEVTHRPDDEDIWKCSRCWYTDEGAAFNVKEEESI